MSANQEHTNKETLVRGLLTLIEEGEISIRFAADALGLSYHEMIDLMAAHSVPVMNYDPAEVDKELEVLRQCPKK